MAGFSVTLLRLDDELTTLWDAPVHTPPCAGASDPPVAAAPSPPMRRPPARLVAESR